MAARETPTHWIAMGMDKDLLQATKIAVRQAVDFLMTVQGSRTTTRTC